MRPSHVMLSIGRPVAYYPKLAKHVGGVKACLFLCQLLYWSNKASSPMGVYKESGQWELETGLSYREQATARKALKQAGLLIETHKRLEHKIYYRIDFDALDEVILAIDLMDNPRNDESATRGDTETHSVLTENTTENTSLGDKSPAKPVKQRTAKRKTQMPDGFQPRETHIAKAKQHSINLTHEFEQFCNYHLSKGSTFADWDRALHTWLGNAVKFSRGGKSGRPSMKTSFENADYTGYDEAAPDWLGGGQ